MRIIKHSLPLRFEKEYSPPGDKSISHRSIFLSALGENEVKIDNFLFCDDCLRTVNAFQNMGVNIKIENKVIRVNGVGLKGLKSPPEPLYLGNSGTTARLLIGVLSAQQFECELYGDKSLNSRPMARVTDPLSLMGAKFIFLEREGYLPLKVLGSKLTGIEYKLPVASAQVKSALLLAGLYAAGSTVIVEPAKSRDHTERMLREFGVDIKIEGLRVEIASCKKLFTTDLVVPGDISSAAFFIALTLLLNNSCLVIKNVGINPTRMGFVEAVRKMGGDIKIIPYKELSAGEPVGDIIIKSSPLKAIEIKKEEIPLMIDELPLIFLLACYAQGTTRIYSASELRVKETDRINSITANLNAMGAEIEVEGYDVIIHGGKKLKGANLNSFGDHRTAMTAVIAAVVADGDSEIDDLECVRVSYPDFVEDLNKILARKIEIKN
jgi:3-phosphoshikimate 1-carboxyvinyltransferase